MNSTEPRTGRLLHVGKRPLGMDVYDYWRCVDCGSEYPATYGSSPTCNGHGIRLCPWCRPDGAPWTAGRGR